MYICTYYKIDFTEWRRLKTKYGTLFYNHWQVLSQAKIIAYVRDFSEKRWSSSVLLSHSSVHLRLIRANRVTTSDLRVCVRDGSHTEECFTPSQLASNLSTKWMQYSLRFRMKWLDLGMSTSFSIFMYLFFVHIRSFTILLRMRMQS